ncbi:hypothetical protein ACMDCT_06060 [Halomonadaceae bacterium KBTZ08]
MARQFMAGERLRRRIDRWHAWQRDQLDSMTAGVAGRLDRLNQALAWRAVPRSRQERVEELLRERRQQGPTLEVIEGGERRDPTDH